MKKLIVLSPKGGSGKTTVARNLAAASAAAGIATGTLDTDPQATLSKWWDRRPGHLPRITHYQLSIESIAQEPQPLPGLGLLIVDTPPAVEMHPAAIKLLMLSADLIIMPCQATIDDLESTLGAIAFARTAGRPMVVVLNRIKPRVREVTEARRTLAPLADVSPVDLPDLTEFHRSANQGLGVVDLEGARAAADVTALWGYVAARLELAP